MGIIDEMKLEYRSGGITQQLIFWNVGLFVFPMILFSVLALFDVDVSSFNWGGKQYTNDYFSLSSDPADLLWKPWSIIVYAFLHHDFIHLFFNMLMLFFSGRVFLTFFTQKQLFGLYLLSAVFAGFFYILCSNILPILAGIQSGMVGASAAIMAILVATATYSPSYQVRLMLIGILKLWQIALFFLVLDLIYASIDNTGGHLAHLAGALFGFGYIKLLQNGTDLSKGVTAVTGFFADLFKPRKSKPFKKVHRNANPPSKPFVKKEKDLTQQQIDDILDKISKSGYDSLTKAEKDFLFKAGK